MNSFIKYCLVIVLTAALVGGITYYCVNQRVQDTTTTLTNQVNALQHKVNDLSSQTATNTPIVTATPSSGTVTTAACSSAVLTASLTSGNGTAGTYYYTLNIKNTGATSCVYSGSTKVSLVNSQNAVLGSSATSTTTPLTLPSGGSIASVVAFPDSSNYSGTNACKTGVVGLAVYPSSQTTAITVNNINQLQPGFTDSACSGFKVQAFALATP
jgi:hypothetical protein